MNDVDEMNFRTWKEPQWDLDQFWEKNFKHI